jgi:hypothetical protein
VNVCVNCGQVIVWARSVECWSVNDDAWALSRCAGSFDVMHAPAPVVEVVR